MKLIIDLATYKVEKLDVDSFREIPGVTRNSQHFQLPGHVLVDYKYQAENGPIMFNLFHPETLGHETGHIDIIAQLPMAQNGSDEGFNLFSYVGMMPIRLDEIPKHRWPSGQKCLQKVLLTLRHFIFIGGSENGF